MCSASRKIVTPPAKSEAICTGSNDPRTDLRPHPATSRVGAALVRSGPAKPFALCGCRRGVHLVRTGKTISEDIDSTGGPRDRGGCDVEPRVLSAAVTRVRVR